MKFLNVKTKIGLLIEKAKQNAAKSIAEKILGFISLIELEATQIILINYQINFKMF